MAASEQTALSVSEQNALLFLLWPDKGYSNYYSNYSNYSKSERRQVLLEQCAPAIMDLAISHLRMNIDDQFSTVKSPAPKWYKGDALVATVSVIPAQESHSSDIQHQCQQMLEQAGFRVGSYRVQESIYKDYGDNQHFRQRDWPDGERSPTEQAVTLLTRPKKYSHEQWIQRWHGNMSPVSETLQPRARYVRNVIIERKPGSPAFDGMVEEAWPSPEHITNPYLFYCADGSTWQLIKNMVKLLRAVMHFHQLHKIRTVTMSEYFLLSS